MSEGDKPVAEMSFEEAMAALEGVVGQLERGEVALSGPRVKLDSVWSEPPIER